MVILTQLASVLSSWETIFSNKITKKKQKGTKFKRENLKDKLDFLMLVIVNSYYLSQRVIIRVKQCGIIVCGGGRV